MINKDSLIYEFLGGDTGFSRELSLKSHKLRTLYGVAPEQLRFCNKMDGLLGSDVTMADISIDPNANIGKTTLASIMQESNKNMLKFYNLQYIYKMGEKLWGIETANRLLDRLISGSIYANDMHMFFAPYCYNLSIETLLNKGLPFVENAPSAPAKHGDSYIEQCAQLVMYASNHQSGAVGLTGFFVGLSFFKKVDDLDDRQLRQLFQNFIYTINQPTRYSNQTPFLNLSIFDRGYLESLYGDLVFPDGSRVDYESVQHIQKICIESFIDEIKTSGNVFTFPVLTAAILTKKIDGKRVPSDPEWLKWICRINETYGLISFYISDNGKAISSCCRLSSDIAGLEDLGWMNSLGAGQDSVGSVGVCAINIPHIMLNSSDSVDFKDKLAQYADDAAKVVYLRRLWVKSNIEKGFLPLYDYNFISLERQYCTIGFCGLYEAGLFGGYTDREDYMNFAKDAIRIMKSRSKISAMEFEVPFNLEQVPGENMAVNMAKRDNEQKLQDKFSLYSNQWLPLISDADVLSRIVFAGSLDQQIDGGTITHIPVESSISAETQIKLLKLAIEKGVVYTAFNYTLSKCKSCNHIFVSSGACPICGGNDIDMYTRVVGFITPVSHWSKERRNYDFPRRTKHKEQEMLIKMM